MEPTSDFGQMAYYGIPRNTYATVNANINVTEKKAPTDESLRLLREMEQKVKDNFLGSFPLEGNSLNGEVILSVDIRGRVLNIAYELNGVRRNVEIFEWFVGPGAAFHQDMAQRIFEALAKDMADYLTETIVKESLLRNSSALPYSWNQGS